MSKSSITVFAQLKAMFQPHRVFGRQIQVQSTESLKTPRGHVGSWVIGCPDVWANLIIGQVREHVEGIEQVKDLVSGQQLLLGCPIVAYSPRYLAILANLTPYERFNMLSQTRKISEKPTFTPKTTLWTLPQYQDCVQSVGLPIN